MYGAIALRLLRIFQAVCVPDFSQPIGPLVPRLDCFLVRCSDCKQSLLFRPLDCLCYDKTESLWAKT